MKNPEDRIKRWMGWFIIITMVLSVFGIAASFVGYSGSSGFNGFAVAQDHTGLYTVEVDDVTYTFFYHPAQVSFITNDPAATQLLNDAVTAVVSFDPEVEDLRFVDAARFRLAELLTVKGVVATQAVAAPSDNYTLPVIGCEQAAPSQPVLLLELGNVSGVSVDGQCIRLTSETEIQLLQTAESLLYRNLGVLR